MERLQTALELLAGFGALWALLYAWTLLYLAVVELLIA